MVKINIEITRIIMTDHDVNYDDHEGILDQRNIKGLTTQGSSQLSTGRQAVIMPKNDNYRLIIICDNKVITCSTLQRNSFPKWL